MAALLAPQQALTLYFARAGVRAPQSERVPLGNAFGRILAQRIVSDAEYPAAPRSAMDGYAVRSEELPGRLRVCGEIRMGREWTTDLPDGGAVRIPTGGMVPGGADAVVPLEDVTVHGDAIEVRARVPGGDCITPRGSDMHAGETLLERGHRIGAAQLGVLATLGVTSVPVFCRPIVAVMSSGDELVDAGEVPGPAQIRDSNRWAVAGALRALGAHVRHVPNVEDDGTRLEAALREALGTADALVLTGGSSVGPRDHTARVVERLGSPGLIVHGLRVKPGKPTVLASVDGKPVVGLPGNPASALMILEAVAAPIFRVLAGSVEHASLRVARLGSGYRKREGWTWFVPVVLDEANGECLVYPLELRSSSVSLLARASGFMTLDESVEALPAGAQVRVSTFIGS